MSNSGIGKIKSFGFKSIKKPQVMSAPKLTAVQKPPGAYSQSSQPIKRHRTEESYFETSDDETEVKKPDIDYQPAPGSPGRNAPEKTEEDDNDEDDLDSYMASIEKNARKDLESIGKKTEKFSAKGTREDIEAEDNEESFYRWLEENPNAGVVNAGENDEDQEIDYDDDGNIIVPEKSKIIDPLPPIDHSEIEYEKFEKNFYEEHAEIKKLTPAEVEDLKRHLDMKVTGLSPPKPVCSFAHFGFDEPLLKSIRKSEFVQPTPIQAQAIPTALSGRDIIGIAKTGSGKTAAFLWPALVHIMDQREIKEGDGPIVLILAPTRELAQQIYTEAKKYAKVYNITCACAFGGGSLYEQTLACQEGCEILVCTPGRLIDLIKKKGTNLRRVTYLVLDEADRMFDMGFEPQVRSIANQIRPDRQTLLFSATFKKKVEKLAREILTDPIRIIQGELGEANENITQIIKVFKDGPEKWKWLNDHLVEFTSTGKVLIFVTQKTNSAELAKNLQEQGYNMGLLHGDMHQDDRTKVINDFKKSDMPILVATDVAARGLDIPSIKIVLNYDVARDIDTHTHRVGRTARASQTGTAYTLVTPKDKEFCPHLVRHLESSNQIVPQEIADLALQVPWFKTSRYKNGGAKKLNIGGVGLGYRERPGLGAPKGGQVRKLTIFKQKFYHNFQDVKQTFFGHRNFWRINR